MIPTFIQTPRLTLLRLTNPDPSSKHLHWFHENWSDPDATSWSIRGASKTLDDSRKLLLEINQKDNYFYSVFARTDGALSTEENPGLHLGSVGLRTQDSGPTIPALQVAEEDEGMTVNLRILGYAYFKHAWGKGYATEAARALLDAYAAAIAEEKSKGEQVFYVEAGVDEGNPASLAIIKKLGFTKVGFKTESEPAFLGGEWRYDGYWIYGQYV